MPCYQWQLQQEDVKYRRRTRDAALRATSAAPPSVGHHLAFQLRNAQRCDIELWATGLKMAAIVKHATRTCASKLSTLLLYSSTGHGQTERQSISCDTDVWSLLVYVPGIRVGLDWWKQVTIFKTSSHWA